MMHKLKPATGLTAALWRTACVANTNLCQHTVQGDEARHEAAYQRIMDELMRRDPDHAVRAFATMMQSSIVMPAHLMRDGDDASADLDPPGAARAGGAAASAGAQHESPFFKSFAGARRTRLLPMLMAGQGRLTRAEACLLCFLNRMHTTGSTRALILPKC
jgi:Fatty acid desaturase